MVEANLTKELIDTGAKLVQKLDKRGLAPDAAFWLYSPEEQTWKLVLVEVKLAKKGPKAAYAEMQKILAGEKELGNLRLDDLVLENRTLASWSLFEKPCEPDQGSLGFVLRIMLSMGR